jgi:DNA transformation protein
MAKAAPPEYVRHVHDQIADLGDIDIARFFGGWGFRAHGVQFAVCLRGQLWLCVDEPLRSELAARGCEPFRYDKRDRQVTVERFYSLPEECLDDPEELRAWMTRAMGAARR